VIFDPASLPQSWPMPSAPRPIVILGAGGIVQDAHMPAYRKGGFPVAGVYDIDPDRTSAMAERWGIRAFRSLDDAVADPAAVFDLATPPAAHLGLLRALPDGATVLIQKPMGRTLDEATAILRLCQMKKLIAAVNFQLRFAPMVLPLRAAIAQGLLGRIVDVEVHLNLVTPWNLFPFLNGLERVEIAVHSIHYLDLIRAVLGNPVGVHARTLGHPNNDLAQTRTAAILDFAPDQRCVLSINHDHNFGRRFQDAKFRFEGDKGAAVIQMGLLLNYPDSETDEAWINTGGDWVQIPLAGRWFPDAFIGRMANLQRFAGGEDEKLESAVDDAWHTMALVEACFRSAAAPATPVPTAP
jgi:predicted dehydrogenase